MPNATTPARPPEIRLAVPADVAAIREIFNHYIHTSTSTFFTESLTSENRQRWFDAHGPAHPVTVAVIDGEVVGWGALSSFNERQAFDHTVENSVYVKNGYEHRGIGRALLSDLVSRARSLGHHTIIAVICAEQAASVGLHESLGFLKSGQLCGVGHKFGRWLDVVYHQLLLEPAGNS